jgi:hypothetical protein
MNGHVAHSSFDLGRIVVFMHIPKTAGTAFTAALATALRPSVVVNGFDRSGFGSFREFDAVAASVRQSIHETVESISSEADFVCGHMALSTLRQAYPAAQFITILREPTSRLLSHWLYWRQASGASLSSWGPWGDRMRYARQPLASFLDQPLIACQTDNLAVRMLLWPHPLIPVDAFIDPANDETLVAEALARLRGFSFLDIVENDRLMENLQTWLGQSIDWHRLNESGKIPKSLRVSLDDELTAEAYCLLGSRTRLDLRLWSAIALQSLPDRDISELRVQTVLTNAARYASLLV